MITPATSVDPDAWHPLVAALPIPAAVLDADGRVCCANSWVTTEPGHTMFDDVPVGGLTHIGRDQTRWHVEALAVDGSYFLATADAVKSGDHMIRRLFATTDVLFAIYDDRGCIIECNEAWERLLGHPPRTLIGRDSWTLVHPDDLVTRSIVERELRQHGHSEPSWRMPHTDGTQVVVHWQLYYDPAIARCFAVGHDVSAQQRRGDELHKRAYTDPLTGLPNRSHIVAELDRHLTNGTYPAALFCDLDHFKLVNDSLGHSAGDELLADLAGRLDHLLRARDCVIGRFGGDEFVVVVPDADANVAEMIASDISRCLRRPFVHGDRQIHLSMSIGIATATSIGGSTPHELLRRADIASYRAKETGRGEHVRFDDDLEQMINRRVNVEEELRRALADGNLETWFQPIVELTTGKIIGAEALARLRRPTDDGVDIVAPDDFLDVAVAAGIMPELGRNIIEQALDLAVDLFTETHTPDFQIGVNVSATELVVESFTTWFLSAVRQRNLPTSGVVLEVTEAAVLSGDAVHQALTRLRGEGFGVVLDDFGTGYSALAHLRSLPITAVKIDRSFVANIDQDATTAALVRSLHELLGALDLAAVVEGVEHDTQAAALRSIGFATAQGWHFHRAMPSDQLLDLVRTT